MAAEQVPGEADLRNTDLLALDLVTIFFNRGRDRYGVTGPVPACGAGTATVAGGRYGPCQGEDYRDYQEYS